MMKFNLLLIFVIIITEGCFRDQNTNKTYTTKLSSASSTSKITFEKRDQNVQNFLFLDFWEGMSKQDYEIIKDSLVSANKLVINQNNNTEFYVNVKLNIAGTVSNHASHLILSPIFKNSVLVGLDLKRRKYYDDDPSDYVYLVGIKGLYMKKYGNPEITKSALTDYQINPNMKGILDGMGAGAYYKEQKEYYAFVSYKWNLNNKVIILDEVYDAPTIPNEITITYFSSEYYNETKKLEAEKKLEKKRRIDEATTKTLNDL